MKSSFAGWLDRPVYLALLCSGGLCLLPGVARADVHAGTRFSGQVIYQGTKAAVPAVLVEAVEADDEGKPDGDEVLGSARADAQGRFTLVLAKGTDEHVALVVYAVRTFAETDGDRRREGYKIKTRRTLLGFLPDPTPAKANTIPVERRRPKHSADDDDDE